MERDFGHGPNEGTTFDHYTPAEEKRTRQSDRDSSDVNVTLKKYNLQPQDFNRLVEGWTGRQLGEFGDASIQPSFMEVLDVVNRAKDAFMQFPPEVRAFFKNDPAVMLDSWNKGLHAEVFEELGLLVRAPDVAAEAAVAREARVVELADGVRRGVEARERHERERHERKRRDRDD